MKTKYTLQELKKIGIVIDCPSRKIADKVCYLLNIKPMVNWESDKTYLWVYWSDGFNPDFFNKKWVESQIDKKVIPASEFFMETPEDVKLQAEIKSGLGTEEDPLKFETHILHEEKDEDIITYPIVITAASASFDKFLEQWNNLKTKAMGFKSVKSLDAFTKKITELL